MNYRKLGRTGLDIGEISLGAEHLERADRTTVVGTIHLAVDHGVNYLDLVTLHPETRDSIGAALRGVRDRVMISGHLGSTLQDGTYTRTRDLRRCEASLHDLLARLHTDHVDVLVLHFVDRAEDYADVVQPDGLLGLARRFQQEGKGRFIALSTHVSSIGRAAAASGHFDAIMFPVNAAHDLLPGDGATVWRAQVFSELAARPVDHHEDRRELYLTCQQLGVGLIAMKPFAGGLLLKDGSLADYARSLPDVTSGDLFAAVGMKLTPVQALSYVLSQPGVSTALPGCRTPDEMRAALSYADAAPAERDYSAIDAHALWKLRGRCVYCGHCLPCPAGIEIGRTLRLLDIAERALDAAVIAQVRQLPAPASDCTGCGVCLERCPFGVAVVERMEQAAVLFGPVSGH